MTPASTARQRRLAYMAWIGICLIWGTTYLGIRISLETMPPALMGGLRWLAASALLLIYLVVRQEPLPPPSRWGSIALLGFLLLGLGNGGVVVAEQWVPSGLAAILVAGSPFWMAAIEAMLPDGERIRATTVLGLFIGFVGILVLVWPDLSFEGSSRGLLAGVIAIQIASIGWSLGSSYSRRQKRSENVLATTALQMLAGGIILTGIGTLRGEWASLHFTPRTAWTFAYMCTVGGIGGFVAYTYALRHLPVSFVSLYAYINPIIAVALGILLLNEPFDSRMAVAAALVLAGVAVVRWRSGDGERRPFAARLRRIAAVVLMLAIPAVAAAQDGDASPVRSTESNGRGAASFGKFVAGGAIGLLAHEGGHFLFDIVFDADPTIRRVEFHGIPFFAVTHRAGVSPRREFVISSAGFWVQHAGSEWLLTRRPGLRRERAPIAKGVLAFNVLASGAYAGAAFARTGPYERDTRGMAHGARLDERWIGALVLAPAVLDGWRYFDPEADWAAWISRGVKAAMVLLVFR